jgi:hypothetical protein
VRIRLSLDQAIGPSARRAVLLMYPRRSYVYVYVYAAVTKLLSLPTTKSGDTSTVAPWCSRQLETPKCLTSPHYECSVSLSCLTLCWSDRQVRSSTSALYLVLLLTRKEQSDRSCSSSLASYNGRSDYFSSTICLHWHASTQRSMMKQALTFDR